MLAAFSTSASFDDDDGGGDDGERADPFSDLRSVSAGPRLSSRTTSRRNISASSSSTNLGASTSTETTPPKDKPLPAGPATNTVNAGGSSSLKAAIAEAVTIRPALPHTGSARSLGKLTPQRPPPQRGSSFTSSPAISLPKDQASMDDIPDYYKTEFTAGAPEHPLGKRDAKADKKDRKAAEKEAKKKKAKGGAPLDFIDTLDTIGGCASHPLPPSETSC